MFRLAADENFNGDIVRGLLRRKPDLDIVRVQDVGLSGAGDPVILERAAAERRILVTHDIATLPEAALSRVAAGKSMPGVFALRSDGPIGPAVEDLLLLSACSLRDEWNGQVRFLPL